MLCSSHTIIAILTGMASFPKGSRAQRLQLTHREPHPLRSAARECLLPFSMIGEPIRTPAGLQRMDTKKTSTLLLHYCEQPLPEICGCRQTREQQRSGVPPTRSLVKDAWTATLNKAIKTARPTDATDSDGVAGTGSPWIHRGKDCPQLPLPQVYSECEVPEPPAESSKRLHRLN